ncbi:hypothetical protein [Thalassoroseus pseudoceratinae]|uniref:hypothetical protein n=1 Tax=Thalassoroseus pseudoceratinae TaxID=2713176 RepID=UPI0014241FBC|nr:hypothetical protein [Thalassoroseus pseudoceratinae]
MKNVWTMLTLVAIGGPLVANAAEGPVLAPTPDPEYRTPLPNELPVLPRPNTIRTIPVQPRTISVAQPLPLFPNVRVEDRDNIHPCAVKEIIRVKDPRPNCHACGSPGYVFIEICVPPNCRPEIDIKRKDGSKIEYDYGDYEVEITSKKGYVKIDYDD